MEKTLKISGWILFSFFALNLIATPFWRIAHDTVFIHYIAQLIDVFGYIPYKDIYDTSMPGTFIFHILLGSIFGYTESGLQLFNFFFTVTFWLINYIYLKNISFFPRFIASFYFLLVYQSFGLEMSLQRDFLSCLFIISSVTIILSNLNYYLRLTISGILIGIAFTIKPHLGIGLPVIFFMGHKASFKLVVKNYKKLIINGALYILSFSIPVICSLVWLKVQGGWDDFWFMQKNYIPQYIQLNASHEYVPGRLSRLVGSLKRYFYTIPYWRLAFFCLIFGTYLNLKYDKKNKQFWVYNFILAFVYSITLIVSGQFFPYHFMSFFLFAFFPIAGFFNTKTPQKFKYLLYTSVLVILINNMGQLPIETIKWAQGDPPHITHEGRVDRLMKAIKNEYRPEDTIQVFDWVEGATTHALMNLNIPHYSKFITDHIFKHHLHLDSKKKLNKEFLLKMKKNPPTIIIKSLTQNHPKGLFTTKDLPEDFLSFIGKNYLITHKDSDFLVYRHTEK